MLEVRVNRDTTTTPARARKSSEDITKIYRNRKKKLPEGGTGDLQRFLSTQRNISDKQLRVGRA